MDDATENPLTRANCDAKPPEDTDAVLMPNLCEPLRGVATMRVARVGQVAALVMFLTFCFDAAGTLQNGRSPMMMGSAPAERAPELAAIARVSEGAGWLFGAVLPAELARALSPGGALEKVGVGTQRVSAAAVQRLRWWRAGLAAVVVAPVLMSWSAFLTVFVTVILTGFAGLHAIPMPDGAGGEVLLSELPGSYLLFMIPFFVAVGCCLAIVTSLSLAWFLSLKVATTLAEDSVIEVHRATTAEAIADDVSWHRRVMQPVSQLSQRTMDNLSSG